MNLADVHAHLDLIESSARISVVQRAEEAGVRAVITNSVDSKTGNAALELQEKFGIVRAALGVYPAVAARMDDSELRKELEFMQENSGRIAAVGEIGLDYQETEDRERQQKAFEMQLRMAKRLDVPALVHSRKAEKEVIETAASSGHPKIILHAFHGSMKLVSEAAGAGMLFSIPSNILRSGHFQKIAEIVPLESLLTETDAPYLGPEKEGSSEPAHVELSVRKIAEIRKISAEDAAKKIYGNFERMFGA